MARCTENTLLDSLEKVIKTVLITGEKSGRNAMTRSYKIKTINLLKIFI